MINQVKLLVRFDTEQVDGLSLKSLIELVYSDPAS